MLARDKRGFSGKSGVREVASKIICLALSLGLTCSMEVIDFGANGLIVVFRGSYFIGNVP